MQFGKLNTNIKCHLRIIGVSGARPACDNSPDWQYELPDRLYLQYAIISCYPIHSRFGRQKEYETIFCINKIES